MAAAHLELVRSIYAAWERGDYSSVEWAHPAIEYVWVGGPSPGSWTGLAEMKQAWREFLRAWEGLRMEVDEYRELDAERVLVLQRLTGRGKTSGLELGQMQAQGAVLYHVRDGKVTKLVGYFESERALAELGLAPAADSTGP